MNNNEFTLKNALLEASLKRIKYIESMDYSEIETDEIYDNTIYDTIYSKTASKKYYPKKVALILIASITVCFLILFSISAQVRTTVIDFFVEVYETFTSFFIKKDEYIQTSKIIETIYKPKYLQNSHYKESSYMHSNRYIYSKWTNNDNKIDFSQCIIDENRIIMDAENTQYEVVYFGEQKVYYAVKNDTYVIKWIAYGYSFSISCNTDLDWEEIEKIILSLEPVSE